MLTNSKEYRDLEIRIAKYLNINSDNIESIVNPMRNKKLSYHLITLVDSRFRSILLRDTVDGFTIIS